MLFSKSITTACKGASVPSQQTRFVPSRCAIALALSLAFSLPSAVNAAGLGRLTVQSALGQPLRAEVDVTSVSRDEVPTLAVRLASQSAFRQANLEFNPALSMLRFNLERRGENAFVVQISSAQPVNEPFLDLLLELNWATGRVLREYTVLLDPPSLRAAADVIPPVAVAPAAGAPAAAVPPAAAVSAPAPVGSLPAQPAAPPGMAPAPAPVAAAPAAVAAPRADSGGEYRVKSGDTLGRIALQNKPASVSLDQMLVAMFSANPNAFAGNNMNRLYAGRTLMIPSEADAQAIGTADARREVVAQSRDFAEYRSRLAQVAVVAPAPSPAVAPAPAAAQGRVTAKVEDKAAPAKGGDQLKIAKADTPASGQAAAKADEAVARQRALKEQEERAAELQRANEAAKKALELQSKSGAQAQQAAEAARKAAEAAKAVIPAPAPPPATVVAPAPVPAAVPAVTPAPVEAAKVEAPKAEVAPAPAPAPKKVAPPPPAAPPSTSFVDELLASPTTQIGLGALVVALLGLFGYNMYRRRRVEKADEFQATGTSLRANSLFGSTGGQSIDTGATSTFNSSFIPAASQLDSNEVDPVAEADVYIAYGREEQAEDILKEALRLQPDRHAVRVKLLEIYSRRGDKASFNAVAADLRGRTGGVGEDWERAAKLGRAFDPGNSMYAGAAGAADTVMRGPTTELRLNPNTTGKRPSTLGGMLAPSAGSGGTRTEPAFDLGTTQPSLAPTRSGPETRLSPDTSMPLDTRLTPVETKMPADTRMSANTTTGAPTTKFEATLPLDEPTKPGGQRAGTIDPFGATTTSAIDFSALDFDLGPAKAPEAPRAAPAPAAAMPSAFDLSFEPAGAASFERTMPPTAPTAAGRSALPDVDLNLPAGLAAARPSAPAFSSPPVPSQAAARSALEESLSRPTLLGDVGALPDEQAPRLTSNTDQATVPLIDFDLTGADVELGGRRTETQAGSPLAAQMATKLDLARGYIDLGVKDGARELIEEVMRDGTREQRQQALELMKAVEA